MIVHEIPGIHSVYTKLIQIIFFLSHTCLAVLDWTFSVLLLLLCQLSWRHLTWSAKFNILKWTYTSVRCISNVLWLKSFNLSLTSLPTRPSKTSFSHKFSHFNQFQIDQSIVVNGVQKGTNLLKRHLLSKKGTMFTEYLCSRFPLCMRRLV